MNENYLFRPRLPHSGFNELTRCAVRIITLKWFSVTVQLSECVILYKILYLLRYPDSSVSLSFNNFRFLFRYKCFANCTDKEGSLICCDTMNVRFLDQNMSNKLPLIWKIHRHTTNYHIDTFHKSTEWGQRHCFFVDDLFASRH